MSQDRLPPLSEGEMTPEQIASLAELTSGPRGKVGGPFVPLLRSPELMNRLQKVGEYLRYHNSIGLRNSEFAVLIAARHWSQPFEWHIHSAIAKKEGVSEETIQSINEGRRPNQMNEDESIIYDLLGELKSHHSVSDPTWKRGITRFGEQGVVDMIAHFGYYSLLAMLMNASRTALPNGVSNPLASLPAWD